MASGQSAQTMDYQSIFADLVTIELSNLRAQEGAGALLQQLAPSNIVHANQNFNLLVDVDFVGIAALVAINSFSPVPVRVQFFIESIGSGPEIGPANALVVTFNTVSGQLNYPGISVVVPANTLVQGQVYRLAATVRFGRNQPYAGTGYIEGGIIQTADEITP